MRLVVVGGGIAGAAAAHAAASTGTECLWFLGGVGASSASSGALDWSWDPGQNTPRRLAEAELTFAESYGWRLPADGAQVVTCDGLLRRAPGTDAAVLNLEQARGGVVAVVDLPRPGWDARFMCRALGEQSWSRETNTRFEPLKLNLQRLDMAESLVREASDVEFAAALAQRRSGLAALVRAALGNSPRPRGLLWGPWSCVDGTLAAGLGRELELAVGETTSPAFGVAGARFELARERWIDARGLRVERRFLQRLSSVDGGLVAETGSLREVCERAVLALGGIAGGGLSLDERGGVSIALELTPAPRLLLRGRLLLAPGSWWGVAYEELGAHDLESLGLAPDPLIEGCVSFVGDAEPGRARTVLGAMRSGIAACERLVG